MKTERIIYVVGCSPAVMNNSEVRVFEWFVSFGEARDHLARQLVKDTKLDYDYVIRRLEVPKEIWTKDNRLAIRNWVAANASLWSTASQETEKSLDPTKGPVVKIPAGVNNATIAVFRNSEPGQDVPVVIASSNDDESDDDADDDDMRNGDPDEYQYASKEECVAAGDHAEDCDDDGFCNYCGEQ